MEGMRRLQAVWLVLAVVTSLLLLGLLIVTEFYGTSGEWLLFLASVASVSLCYAPFARRFKNFMILTLLGCGIWLSVHYPGDHKDRVTVLLLALLASAGAWIAWSVISWVARGFAADAAHKASAEPREVPPGTV